MVPISVRTEDQKGAMGNQVSSMLVSLATDIDDPVERLHAISAGHRAAPRSRRRRSAPTRSPNWAEFAAPAVAARAARLYSRMKVADRHRPLFNVTISNVPGPNFPLYSAGARMVAMYPMGPITDGGGAQHHGDELHGHDVLRPRRLPRRRCPRSATSPATSTAPSSELKKAADAPEAAPTAKAGASANAKTKAKAAPKPAQARQGGRPGQEVVLIS